METGVQKWGNCLAMRLSKSVIRESNICEATYVAIGVEEGKTILEVKAKKRYSLRNLLAKVKRPNLHREFEAGPPVGKEIW